MVSHYQLCLLVWSLTIVHAFWIDPYYQPCLLVCCLTIGHAFWCGPSLSTMPIGVVPHYRPCLLISCDCNRHFTSYVQIEGWLQIWYYLYRGVITSDMFAELGSKLQCFLKVKDDLSEVLIFQNVTLNV